MSFSFAISVHFCRNMWFFLLHVAKFPVLNGGSNGGSNGGEYFICHKYSKKKNLTALPFWGEMGII